jgi:hypothetical protein
MSNERSESLGALTKALIQVQRQVNGAKPNKSNPHLKNKYADLASVWDTCRDLLAENGLAVTHTFRDNSGDAVTCVATLLHESGEYMTSSLTLKPGKTSPQEMGSAITYARRYTLAALVGIVVDDDDDGHKASKPSKPVNELEDAKNAIRNALKVYKGADREEIIGTCQIAQESGNFDMKLAREIMEKMLIKK